MGVTERKSLLKKIGTDRSSAAILYATSDRPGMESQISNDAFDYFVRHLDKLWPAKKLTLVLHTNGGNTSAAWRIVNLLHAFSDELEVIVPSKAHSAGTLISLGAKSIVMTKQATLSPIDPSLSSPLSPQVPGNANQRVPVSVEVIQGYIDLARKELGIEDQSALGEILRNLSDKIHPLVLGQIFRTRSQIRELAETLLEHQGVTKPNRKKIIDFLCGESGSHDRTVSRREAHAMGLQVEKPSEKLYQLVNKLYEDIAEEFQSRSRFDPMLVLAGQPTVNFSSTRVMVESAGGGSSRLLTEGRITATQMAQNTPAGIVNVSAAETKIEFDGWREQ